MGFGIFAVYASNATVFHFAYVFIKNGTLQFEDMNQSPVGLGYFFAIYKDGNYRLNTTSRYDIEFYIPNDNGVAHWKTVYSQQFDKDEGNYWFFPVQKYWRMGTNYNRRTCKTV